MKTSSNAEHRVNPILDRFIRSTAGVTSAVSLCADGLPIVAGATPHPHDPDDAQADDAADLVTAVKRLTAQAASASWHADGAPVTQMISELDESYLLVSIGQGTTTVGVVTDKGCDLGLVGYETTRLAERIGSRTNVCDPAAEDPIPQYK